MYAIIVDGGKQYKVREGQEVTIDFRDAQGGDKVTVYLEESPLYRSGS